MTNSKQKKKGSFSVVAGITGAIVGAGVAIAGAVALKDKKNRDKVKKAFTNVKDQAVGYVEKIQKEVKDKTGEVKNKFTKDKKKVTKVAKNVAKDIKKDVTKGVKKI